MSLIPTFAVPLLIMLHVISIAARRWKEEGRSQVGERVPGRSFVTRVWSPFGVWRERRTYAGHSEGRRSPRRSNGPEIRDLSVPAGIENLGLWDTKLALPRRLRLTLLVGIEDSEQWC
jgi:hypothetical protein